MPFEKFDLEEITKERRQSLAKSIRTVTPEELRNIGDEIFRFADDPWRHAYFAFIAEHPGSTCYHAVTHDNVHIVYCRDQDKGIWFMPGTALGPLQERGRKAMAEIIERGR